MSELNDDWQKQEDRYLLSTYAKLPISIERGAGCYVYDSDGSEYLDMYSGHCVTSTGHCHPKVVEAIRKQAGELLHIDNTFYSEPQGKLAKLMYFL